MWMGVWSVQLGPGVKRILDEKRNPPKTLFGWGG